MSPNVLWDAAPNSAAYLRRQQAEARIALQKTVRDLKRDVVAALDPQTWAQISPWATLGVAAASGFGAAAVVVPGRKPSTPVTAEPPETATSGPPVSSATTGKTGTVWAAVTTGLYGLARIALAEVISSAMRTEPLREPENTDVEVDVPV